MDNKKKQENDENCSLSYFQEPPDCYYSESLESSDEFHMYENRLGSYANNPFSNVSQDSAHALSQFGHFYIGPGNSTKCFSCGKVHENWRSGNKICYSNLHETHCHFYSTFEENNPFKCGASLVWNDVTTQTPLQQYSVVPSGTSCITDFLGGMKYCKSILRSFCLPFLAPSQFSCQPVLTPPDHASIHVMVRHPSDDVSDDN